MDIDALKKQLETELAAIEQYTKHPITVEVLEETTNQEQQLTTMVLDLPVTNVETFLAREQMLGHLRGVRQLRGIIQKKVAEAKERLETELGIE